LLIYLWRLKPIPQIELMKWLPTIFQRGSVRELRRVLKRATYAEQQLHALSEKNRILNEGSGNGIIVLSLDGLPVFVAPSVTKMLDYGEDELMRHNIRNILAERSVPVFNEAMVQALENPDKSIDCDLITARH